MTAANEAQIAALEKFPRNSDKVAIHLVLEGDILIWEVAGNGEGEGEGVLMRNSRHNKQRY